MIVCLFIGMIIGVVICRLQDKGWIWNGKF
jgi:uncharacterized membrane-anchored protein YhcB (DUF1043 family)